MSAITSESVETMVLEILAVAFDAAILYAMSG
jgi:hypothetical protein